MRKYAAKTRVTVSASRDEIEHVLMGYGALQVGVMTMPREARLAFRLRDRSFAIPLPMPDPDDPAFKRTEAGRTRTSPDQVRKACQQEVNRRWRCLLVAVKSAIEMSELGAYTFEDAFLALTMLPGGRTVGEVLESQVQDAIRGTGMLALMPASE